MKQLLALTKSCLAITLLVATGLSSYGCRDTVSVSQDVQVPLASLTVTPGILQPGFSSNTTSYSAEAPTSAASVTVAATPKDVTTTVTINGIITTQRSITLGSPGSTTNITIVLSSQTGTESTYTVSVLRLLSSDNNLSALTVTSGPLNPAFAAGTLTYTVDVATSVASVTVSATKSDPNASMLIGSVPVPAGTASGQALLQLDGPGTSKTVSITVTAPNGSLKTYAITVKRAASGNNNLSALNISPGTLVPAFASSTLDYIVDVATDVTEVTVSVTKADPNAVLFGSISDPGAGIATGQATIPLNGEGTATPVSITVIAPDTSSKIYNIIVNRAPAAPPSP